MEPTEPPPDLASTHMVGATAARENAPRERQLPLRGLENLSMIGYQKTEGKSMSFGEITISIEEYKKLLKIWAATEAFISFVKASKYSPDREDCARFLGFELGSVIEET